MPHRTPAELAREKKLRDDPMAEVHGPLFVTCKRCGNRIKLSPKSSYDPFHWMKHRERCLRKPVGQARPSRRAPKEAHTPLASKKSPPSSSNTDGDNVTPPPLTPEDERTSSHVIKQRSPTPTAHGIIIPPKSITFPITERWQTWTWSELRYSKWLTDTNLIPVDDEQDDGDGDSDTLLGPFTQENLPWLYRGMHNPDSTSLPT